MTLITEHGYLLAFATSLRLVQTGFTHGPYVQSKSLHFKLYFCHSVVAFTMILLTGELDLGTIIIRMALYADQHK